MRKLTIHPIQHILKLLDNNQRLSEQDAIWLNSEGRRFFTDKVKIKFHRIEADFYINGYKATQSHWDALCYVLIIVSIKMKYQNQHRLRPRNSLVPLVKFKKAGRHVRSQRKLDSDEKRYKNYKNIA